MSLAKKQLPVIAALAAFISGVVDERLAELQVEHEKFTSSKPAPHVSRRVHNKECRSGNIAGAYRDGREWVCTKSAWLAARATKPKIATVHPIRVTEADLDELAMNALEGAGLRVTKRGSR